MPDNIWGSNPCARLFFSWRNCGVRRQHTPAMAGWTQMNSTYLASVGCRFIHSISSISMSTKGEAGGVSVSWPACIVLRRFVMRLRLSRAVVSCVVSTSMLSLATLPLLQCGDIRCKKNFLLDGIMGRLRALTTTVLVASVSDDSVGESTGVVRSVTSAISRSCLGCGCYLASVCTEE